MQSMQLRGYRGAVHTVGLTANGILYVDVQRFNEAGDTDATTHYIRASDVARIKRLASQDAVTTMTDQEFIRLFAASFDTAEYALEWLQWAQVPTVVRHDEDASFNAEDAVPHAQLNALSDLRVAGERDLVAVAGRRR